MNTVKKLQKIHEALNHMSKAVSLVEEAKNIDVSGVDYAKPDSERTSVLTVKVKTELSDETKHLLQDLAIREIDTEQIEERAAMLYDIYVRGQFEALENLRPRPFSKLDEHHISGFKAIARHLATPRSDVQHALQAALESERELMDILRKIGKVFGKNVGTDIGILDLPKLVDDQFEQLRELRNNLVTCTGNTYTNKSFTDDDLINEVTDLHRLKQKVTEYLKTSYAFTGNVGVHPDSCKLMTEVGEMTACDNVFSYMYTKPVAPILPVPFSEVKQSKFYGYNGVQRVYGQFCGVHFDDGCCGFLKVYDVEDGDVTDNYISVDLSMLFEDETTDKLNSK